MMLFAFKIVNNVIYQYKTKYFIKIYIEKEELFLSTPKFLVLIIPSRTYIQIFCWNPSLSGKISSFAKYAVGLAMVFCKCADERWQKSGWKKE